MATHCLGGILSGCYALLWVGTPADWHVRLPGNGAGPRDERYRNILTKALALNAQLVMAGSLGYFFETNSCTRGSSEPATQILPAGDQAAPLSSMRIMPGVTRDAMEVQVCKCQGASARLARTRAA
eukprot:4195712-Pyramimonas_sp.AAC.1